MNRYIKAFGFYRSLAPAFIIINMCCWSIIWDQGITALTVLLFFKVFAGLTIWAYVTRFRKEQFYYYYNLHVSLYLLWAFSFLFDLFQFLTGVWIIVLVK